MPGGGTSMRTKRSNRSGGKSEKPGSNTVTQRGNRVSGTARVPDRPTCIRPWNDCTSETSRRICCSGRARTALRPDSRCAVKSTTCPGATPWRQRPGSACRPRTRRSFAGPSAPPLSRRLVVLAVRRPSAGRRATCRRTTGTCFAPGTAVASARTRDVRTSRRRSRPPCRRLRKINLR